MKQVATTVNAAEISDAELESKFPNIDRRYYPSMRRKLSAGVSETTVEKETLSIQTNDRIAEGDAI